MNRNKYLKHKDDYILQIVDGNCPKCFRVAEVVIMGKVNRQNNFIEETVRSLGYNCKHCGFRKKIKT